MACEVLRIESSFSGECGKLASRRTAVQGRSSSGSGIGGHPASLRSWFSLVPDEFRNPLCGVRPFSSLKRQPE